jgi:cytochrome c oxidase subunit 2
MLLMALPFFPREASAWAGKVDALFFFLLAVAIFFTFAIFLTIAFFAIKYHRKSDDEVPPEIHGSLKLEIVWTLIPFALTLVMFAWGAKIYFNEYTPPASAMDIYVVGKQWMWKIQHPEGKSEIDALHVPVGQPIRLTMTSEDVIHDFYIPAFRVKKDVLPGRYTTYWFTPTKVGAYHLFCAQYCGTNHSAMIGTVYVMEPADFEQWLAGNPSGETMAQTGERLFVRLNCVTCHKAGGRGPVLDGVFGSTVQLKGGGTALADEAYLRESILTPQAKVVEGYKPVMPTFQGQVTETQVLQLIAYIKSLEGQKGTAAR